MLDSPEIVNTEVKPKTRPKLKAAKAPKDPGTIKLSSGQIHLALAEVMCGDQNSLLPKFPYNIQTYRLPDKSKQMIEVQDQGHCVSVSLPLISEKVANYCRDYLSAYPMYSLTARGDVGVAEKWFLLSKSIDRPKYVLFRDEPGLCFNRIPFSLKENTKGQYTPNFNELMSRTVTNTMQLKAFIWSLFEERSYSQQYLWLYGDGNDGKGSLFRLLARLFGSAATTQNTVPWLGNKHWAVPFVNKRLAIFSDLKDESSMDNPILKALTGGDQILVDPKNKDAFTVALDCKLVFSSNHTPNIENTNADRRRIIFVEFKQATNLDNMNYENDLWEEAPYFLDDCRKAYRQLCPNHQRITMDDAAAIALDQQYGEKTTDMEYLFRKFFVSGAAFKIAPVEVTAVLKEAGEWTPQVQRKFNKWLEDHGFKKIGKVGRMWVGFSKKPFSNLKNWLPG